jgi:crotonobetainyl-CoA:carnitine CoA-transferase CaiB-like acyl-CoA transferase
MLESLTFLHTYDAVMYLSGGPQPRAWGTQHAHLVPWQAFETSDGYVVVATREERLWRNFCVAIELAELADDPAYRSNPDRVAHREDLIPILEERMRSRTTAAWLEALALHEVPVAPVNDLAHALVEPTLTEHRAIVDVPYSPFGQVRMLANPVRVTESETSYGGPPGLGQDTDDVLRRVAGYDAARIAALLHDQVAFGPTAVPPERDAPIGEPA